MSANLQVTEELREALLVWADTFEFTSGRTLERWQDFDDGQIIWDILHELDPTVFRGILPRPNVKPGDGWTAKRENLDFIYKQVTRYLRQQSAFTPPSADLEAIAKHTSDDEGAKVGDHTGDGTEINTEILTQLLLCAFAAATTAPRYGAGLASSLNQVKSTLGEDSVKVLMVAMTKLKESWTAEHNGDTDLGTESDTTESERDSDKRGVDRDPLLEAEEKLIRAYSQITDLTEEKKRLQDQVGELNNDLESAHGDLAKYQSRSNSRRTSDETAAYEHLKAKLQSNDGYIAELESDLANTKAREEDLERRLEKAKQDNKDQEQRHKDEVQVISHERDDYYRKYQANSNLKKKLEALQDTERQNERLRNGSKELEEQLGEKNDECEKLQRSYDEAKRALETIEQQLQDVRDSRTRLESKYYDIKVRNEALEEQNTQHLETIEVLKERLQEGATTPGVSSATQGIGNLGEELEAGESAADRRPATSGDGISKVQFESLERRHHILEGKYNDALTENLGFESAIAELQQDSAGPEWVAISGNRIEAQTDIVSSHPFIAEQRRLKTALSDLERIQSEAQELSFAIEAAKNPDEQLKALVAKYESLRGYARDVETARDEYRSLLHHALTAGQDISKTLEEEAKEKELQTIIEQFNIARNTADSPAERKVASNIFSKLEAGRVMVKAAEVRLKDVSTDFITSCRSVSSSFKLRPVDASKRSGEVTSSSTSAPKKSSWLSGWGSKSKQSSSTPPPPRLSPSLPDTRVSALEAFMSEASDDASSDSSFAVVGDGLSVPAMPSTPPTAYTDNHFSDAQPSEEWPPAFRRSTRFS